MLTRVYIDNFRCLVNFELRLDRLNLLLGENGTGKTTVFDVLRRLQRFVTGSAKVDTVFPAQDLTRWQSSRQQRLELDLQIGQRAYTYSLVVEHDEDLRRMRVGQEKLLMDGTPLFELVVKGKEATAHLYHDDFSAGPEYPFDWSQSGVGSLPERRDNTNLSSFRRELKRLIIAAPCPPLMEAETQQEEDSLSWDMRNFVSWYRWLSQEHQGAVFTVFQELKDVLPGFTSFSLKEAGENARVLKASFDGPGGSSKPIPYTLGELSDGQRMLIALYTMLFGLGNEGLCLFLDEPDNYVALREIQPWLMALTDRVGKGIEQAVLISHHPEVIDYLAGSAGRWFERDATGPARVGDKPKAQPEGLKPSETITRGWDK
jgi:predicted ATPase